jgi:predicted lipid-binding transport protein (Tim44 family)
MFKEEQNTMKRTGFLLAATAAMTLALSPGLAWARLGGGSSSGSRGSNTHSAPPPTNTAPSAVQPMQRTTTQQAPAPSPGAGVAGSQAMQPRSSFMSGMMGGLIGVGIGGLLLGHGFMGGGLGGIGFLGLLLQIILVGVIGRFLCKWFMNSRRPAMAGGPDIFARNAQSQDQRGQDPRMMGGNGGGTAAARLAPITVTPADYQEFEQILQGTQAAWSAQDLNGLRAMATPEMSGYFAEQLAEQSSRGVRNTITDVRLESGDLSEAWAEQDREYATVAMRFSMVDVTRDGSGRVVDGSPTEHVTATEVWTFVRSRGGRWILSAIQQTR